MASARTSNGFGGNPITFTDIAAWMRLTGARPSIWDVQMLRRMDSTSLAAAATTRDKDAPTVEVRADDVEGVTSILSGFKARGA